MYTSLPFWIISLLSFFAIMVVITIILFKLWASKLGISLIKQNVGKKLVPSKQRSSFSRGSKYLEWT